MPAQVRHSPSGASGSHNCQNSLCITWPIFNCKLLNECYGWLYTVPRLSYTVMKLTKQVSFCNMDKKKKN